MASGSQRRSAAETFTWLTGAIHARLPRWLKWLPVTWIGFAIIAGSSFVIDMIVLTLLHGTGLAYPFAVTLAYGVASVANFIFNRWLNFKSHGDIAKQSGKQLFVVVSNYVIWILLFSSFLEGIGVHFQLARIIAACIEGVYLYLMMRLWVFPRRNTADPEPDPVKVPA